MSRPAMPALAPGFPAGKPAHRTLLLLAAVFVLPFVIGTALFWSGWRPGQFANHGELLQPPRPLPAGGLLAADGRLPITELHGKWLLILPVKGGCAADCEASLHAMRQAHRALGKEQNRVRRVLLDSSSGPVPAGLAERDPELVVAAVSRDASEGGWDRTFPGEGAAIYLVDPLSNVIMRYGQPVEARGVLKDLERLLKYSWIR